MSKRERQYEALVDGKWKFFYQQFAVRSGTKIIGTHSTAHAAALDAQSMRTLVPDAKAVVLRKRRVHKSTDALSLQEVRSTPARPLKLEPGTWNYIFRERGNFVPVARGQKGEFFSSEGLKTTLAMLRNARGEVLQGIVDGFVALAELAKCA